MIAEESEDGQEKTEEPTSRKLEKAAEEGQVLSSKEMYVFTGIIMLFGQPKKDGRTRTGILKR